MALVLVYYVRNYQNNMDNSLLRNIQLLQMVIMDEIHRVCVDNNLRYYLIGGSALGAIRHDGFIPWDPDIDIAMPREDYELFVTKYFKQLNPKFACHSHYTDKFYYPPHALVVLKGSSVERRIGMIDKDIRPSEIFVDVLPLDAWTNDKFSKKIQQRVLKIIKRVKFRKLALMFPGDSFLTKMSKVSYRLLLKPFTWTWLNSLQQDVMMKHGKKASEDWCSKASHYSFDKLTMSSSIFGTPTLHKFEDREYYVQEHVEAYLSHLFGDYTKLPPIEEQYRLSNIFEKATWPDGLI